MHGIQRILAHHFADLEYVTERAADADHLHVGLDIGQPFDAFELFGEELFHLFRLLFGGKPVVLEKIRERDRAER